LQKNLSKLEDKISENNFEEKKIERKNFRCSIFQFQQENNLCDFQSFKNDIKFQIGFIKNFNVNHSVWDRLDNLLFDNENFFHECNQFAHLLYVISSILQWSCFKIFLIRETPRLLHLSRKRLQEKHDELIRKLVDWVVNSDNFSDLKNSKFFGKYFLFDLNEIQFFLSKRHAKILENWLSRYQNYNEYLRLKSLFIINCCRTRRFDPSI